jgi:hypothetical protein
LSNTVEDRMKVVETTLDEYEKNIGLPPPVAPGPDEELQKYFTMDRTILESLSMEDSIEIALRLAQFAAYVQRIQNREKSRISWAKKTLNEVIGTEMANYDRFIKYEVKVALITKDNSFASKLNDIIAYAQQRIDRLDYMSNNIKFISEILMRFKK